MYNRIIVPLDGSKLAECVVPHVKTVAANCELSDITLVRVVEPPKAVALDTPLTAAQLANVEEQERIEAERYLEKMVAEFKFNGTRIETKVVTGDAAKEIAKAADSAAADLVVIATHGRSGIKRWVLGSVADQVMRASCVPVLMVRVPGCMAEF
jgi:nucleotide-binding universal stress UspA family protein